MASGMDKAGRPIVAVTGIGVVTSLGAGKTDNWAKLTAGQSGIRAITRFPTDGLKTRIAGTVDFLGAAAVLGRARGTAGRSRRRGGDRAIRHRRARRFSRSAVPRGAADRDGMAAAARARRQAPAPTTPSPMTTCCARATSFPPITSASCSARSPTIWPRSSAPRARRSRCRPPAPRARPRSSSASRRSAAAKPTRRSASAPTARSIRKR